MRTTKTYYGIQLYKLNRESSCTILRTLFDYKKEAESMLKVLLDSLDQLELDDVVGELVEFSVPIEEVGINNPTYPSLPRGYEDKTPVFEKNRITCEEK